ncbi:hypothetical protein [Kingella sp. (in: b-proteobacteria)]|uniref:hypothetical protein n=1 Tax=Kingella sp. (in: b-proteobacteria) TaxID=2020713 RepID=UPI0026DBFFE8|nr:hypothetical protein [Kingella sp. (in: b-proteobacteria)]MDO4658566.1 hypothetical protein [Kingella sp. (in: b-proteobacteria)]
MRVVLNFGRLFSPRQPETPQKHHGKQWSVGGSPTWLICWKRSRCFTHALLGFNVPFGDEPLPLH